ncbi:MAG: glycerophosphodiester phosphodiesterase, partial [Thermomicrobiales bacterium]
RRPAPRFAVSSFNHDVLRHLRRRNTEIELWPLTVGATDESLGAAVDLGSRYLAIHEEFVNEDIVTYLRSRGLAAWVWTVNDPQRAAVLSALGVAGICADDPDRLLRAGLASSPVPEGLTPP